MTNKQASNWVKKNCAFAQKQELLSIIKKAALEKGVDLPEKALTCHAAAILVMATLKALAARVNPALINEGMKAAYDRLSATGRPVDPGTLATRVLESILEKAKPPVRRPVATSPEFYQSLLSAKQLAKNYLAGLSLAERYHPTKGKPIGANPIGANPEEPPLQRARLTPPRPPRPPQRPAPQTFEEPNREIDDDQFMQPW